MKDKIIRIIGIIAAIITIISSAMFFVKNIMIPAVGPFSLAVVMLSLIYSSKQQYKEGKISKDYWRVILIMGLVAFIGNIIAGISQISLAIAK